MTLGQIDFHLKAMLAAQDKALGLVSMCYQVGWGGGTVRVSGLANIHNEQRVATGIGITVEDAVANYSAQVALMQQNKL